MEQKVRSYDLLSSMVWFLIGLGFSLGGTRYGLGPLTAPGPGFLPFVVGVVLSLLSIGLFVMTLRTKNGQQGKVNFWKEKKSWKNILYSLLSLIFFLVLLDHLGYIVTTFVFFVYLIKFVGKKRWGPCILIAILGTFISYLIFGLWLEIPLPQGIIKIRLM